MKIIAFLQNPWFKPGVNQRVIDRYNNDKRYRRIILSGSVTGIRLEKAFGRDLFDLISWYNSSLQTGTTSNFRGKPDPVYMHKVILEENPDMILIFGKIAEQGIERISELLHDKKLMRKVFRTQHPTARNRTQSLQVFSNRIKSIVDSRVKQKFDLMFVNADKQSDKFELNLLPSGQHRFDGLFNSIVGGKSAS